MRPECSAIGSAHIKIDGLSEFAKNVYVRLLSKYMYVLVRPFPPGSIARMYSTVLVVYAQLSFAGLRKLQSCILQAGKKILRCRSQCRNQNQPPSRAISTMVTSMPMFSAQVHLSRDDNFWYREIQVTSQRKVQVTSQYGGLDRSHDLVTLAFLWHLREMLGS